MLRPTQPQPQLQSRYFVTYAVMTEQVGANMLWHALLGLTYWPGPGKKAQLTNAWGYYAAPMAKPDNILEEIKVGIKKKAGISFDFTGNYGYLKNEDVRFLDLGYGLKGETFEITYEQFMDLKVRCRNRIAIETQAIESAKDRLIKAGIETPDSVDIYQEELRLAAEEKRPSRLEEFSFHYSLKDGFAGSQVCKTGAIGLLRDIKLEEQHVKSLIPYSRYAAFPRIRNKENMEDLLFHSTGPRILYPKKNTFFRAWGPQTKLYWSLLPQVVVTKDEKLAALMKLPEKYVEPMKRLITELQKLELAIVNAAMPAEAKDRKQALVDKICGLYGAFSLLNGQSKQSEFETKITEATSFLDNVFAAVNEDANRDKSFTDYDFLSRLPALVKAQIREIIGPNISQHNSVCRM